LVGHLLLAAVSRGVGQTNADTFPVLTLKEAHELAFSKHWKRGSCSLIR